MARPKLIDDYILLELIEKYFYEKCGNNIKKLRPSEIVKYINANGYPNYPATTLRRTEAAMAYIEELKSKISENDYITTVSYQTIDAASLVDTNRSRSSLIRAITERDQYYKTIADSAIQSLTRYNQLKQQCDENEETIEALQKRITELEEMVCIYKSKIKSISAELNAYKSVVDTYVYPEIANELLVCEGAIRQTDSLIKEDALQHTLITSTTDITKTTKSGSNIITGLFNGLDE